MRTRLPTGAAVYDRRIICGGRGVLKKSATVTDRGYNRKCGEETA